MKGITGFQSSFKGKSKVVFLQDIQSKESEENNFFEEYENLKTIHRYIWERGYECCDCRVKGYTDSFSFVNSSRTLFTKKKIYVDTTSKSLSKNILKHSKK